MSLSSRARREMEGCGSASADACRVDFTKKSIPVSNSDRVVGEKPAPVSNSDRVVGGKPTPVSNLDGEACEKASRDFGKEIILDVRGVEKSFATKSGLFGAFESVKAVCGVSFTVERGTTLGVVGESGCGKTTMGRALLRLCNINRGEVIYRGLSLEKLTTAELRRALPKDKDGAGWERDALLRFFGEEGVNIYRLVKSALRKLRPDIQMIFQDPYSALNPRLPVGDIIGEAAMEHGIVGKADYRLYLRDIMEDCGLSEHHTWRYPHEFSGGQRQRICIARALALKPKLVVCDEPVSALDVSVQAQIVNLLKRLQREWGLTYIFISHDLSVVRHISDRVGVMYLGQMVELAPTEALFSSPLHPYTQALLSAIPSSDPERRMKRIVIKGDLPNPASPPSGCRFHQRCPECRERCLVDVPRLRPFGSDHLVACHLYPENNGNCGERDLSEENGKERGACEKNEGK